MAVLFPRVIALSFLLNDNENTSCPIIFCITFCATDAYSCTFLLDLNDVIFSLKVFKADGTCSLVSHFLPER